MCNVDERLAPFPSSRAKKNGRAIHHLVCLACHCHPRPGILAKSSRQMIRFCESMAFLNRMIGEEGAEHMRLSLEEVYRKYARNIYIAAFSVSANASDAEDVLSDTLVKYHHAKKEFASDDHLKAWLLRTAMNRAKDMQRSFWRRNRISFEDYMEEIPTQDMQSKDLLAAVMHLPPKLRAVVYLYYYEGYPQKEIGKILRIPKGTVNSRMSAARKELKHILKEEQNDE